MQADLLSLLLICFCVCVGVFVGVYVGVCGVGVCVWDMCGCEW